MTMFSFDYFNRYEIPNISLENPDGTVLYNLGTIYDRQLNLKFNAFSEFIFSAPSQINGVATDYYTWLEYRRVVNVNGIGKFIITEPETMSNGINEYKKVTCKSLEYELTFKKLTVFGGPSSSNKGTYPFYNLITPHSTLIGYILDTYLLDWGVGWIDTNLETLSRTFNVTDKTLYDFMMNDVSQAYQCIFTFDTINKKINAYTVTSAITSTDIFLSYENVLKQTDLKENTDELLTSLTVLGGNNLAINQVNPLGTNNIYNYDYYKNTNWMSSSLVSGLNSREARVSANQTSYAGSYTALINENAILLGYESDLATLQGILDADLDIQSARIQQGLSTSAINIIIETDRDNITAKNAQITSTSTIMVDISGSMTYINNQVSLVNFFTPPQLATLSTYTIGGTYTNTNYVQYDSMSASDIQEKAQGLYDQATAVLAKVAQPRYTFSVDSVNFPFLKEFQTFSDQLVLGAILTVEYTSGSYIYPALLEMDINYDKPDSFKMTFSNRLRLDNSDFELGDLLNQAVNSGQSAVFNSPMWSNWTDNYKDDVSLFITSALDAARNAVVTGTNQEMIMDGHGFRGRKTTSGSNFEPEQFWMIHNMLAFTDDNWDHAKLALGKINVPGSGSAFGLVNDEIYSQIIDWGKIKYDY